MLVIAALLALSPGYYDPCAHGPDEPAPVYAAGHRDETRRIIRDAVAELGGSPALERYLVAVAVHESGLRRGLVHRLPADVAGARAAWRNRRAALRRAGNPWADEPDAWLTYGLFGATSAYFAEHVPGDDPRLLCDAWSSIVAYVGRARALLPKLRRCHARPTWGHLYAAIQLGRPCGRGRRGDFHKLVRAHKIDPMGEVRGRDLGVAR